MSTERLALRLYVAGRSPNSEAARRNLRALLERAGSACDLEVIDVFEAPERALADGIVLTPTLLKVAPPPTQLLVGDLRDPEVLRLALGLPTAA